MIRSLPLRYGYFFLLSSFILSIGGSSCTQFEHEWLNPKERGWKPNPLTSSYLSTTEQAISSLRGLSTKGKLDSLLYWANILQFHDEETALVYADEAYNTAVEKNQQLSQAYALYFRAVLKSRNDLFGERTDDALADAKISYHLMDEADTNWKIRITSLLGSLFYSNYRLDPSYKDSARHYVNEALAISEKVENPQKELYYLKGQIYGDLADTEADSSQKIRYYSKSIINAEKSGNLSLLSVNWLSLGYYFMEWQDLGHADSAVSNSEKYALSAQDSIVLGSALQAKADLLQRQYYFAGGQQENFDTSLEYINKALTLGIGNLHYTYNIKALLFYDRLVLEHGLPPKTYTNDGDSAIVYYHKAITETIKEKSLGSLRPMVIDLSNLCRFKELLTGESCNALMGGIEASEYLSNTYDELALAMRAQLKGSDIKFRKFERRTMEAKNEQNIIINWLISGSALLFTGFIFLFIYQRQQQKRLEARMEALRAQINPHFFSNSLNAIDNLVNMGKNRDASKYLIHFSRLSRKLLSHSRSPYTTLADELQTLKHFLELEKLRFRDKLSYIIDIQAGLEPTELEVPALILQPYVENAILHGIKPKKEESLLTIRVRRAEKELICEIEDDGIGRKKAQELQRNSMLKKHKSQGMAITEERITLRLKIEERK